MPSIDIRHPHCQSHDDARAAVEHVAEKIQERFSIDCAWNGDALEFNRSGVEGEIRLLPSEVHVVMHLGFMLSMLRGPIESEIRRYLEREFS